MSIELVAAVMGVGGLSAVIGAIVTGLFSKRKLGAEATEIITKAAAGVVTNLNAEVQRQQELLRQQTLAHEAELNRMAKAHTLERREWQRVLQLHIAWDTIAIERLSEVGVELPPVPPVTPATRYVDSEGRPLALSGDDGDEGVDWEPRNPTKEERA